MDRIREEKLLLYKRVEKNLRNFEDNEAKANEVMQRISASTPTSIGPANDLLRFLYILDQQNQSDTNENRTQAREDLLNYINQFQSPEDVEEEQEEEEQEENQDDGDNNQQQPSVFAPINQQPIQSQPVVVAPQPPAVIFAPPQPQPPAVIVAPQQPQPPVVTFAPPQPQPPVVTHIPPQPTASSETFPLSLLSTREPDYIRPNRLIDYLKLLSEAQQYEKRYLTVAEARKKQLAGPLKAIINKLREDTFNTLTKELLAFLNGQEQIVLTQVIRISTEEERLLCLSMTASLVFNQLLGGDLDDVKTRILLPLVGLLSEDQRHIEFRTIFLDRLHKKCPYTVPYYPKRQPTMSDKEYLKSLGYVEKKESNQVRWETENEYFDRMSGLIRFFCKLLVRRGPPFDSKLDYAWRWMSDAMNLPPRPNITAIILRIFLDETGENMLKEYGRHFVNIINAIETQYLPRLRTETTDSLMERLLFTLDTLKKRCP